MEMDCDTWTKKIEQCNARHGTKNEKCFVAALKEKQCLAFSHCPREAKAYYGTPPTPPNNIDDATKALCASWEEAYCFGNPRIMGIDSGSSSKKKKNVDNEKVFEHHSKAKRKVINNRKRFRDCRDISDALTRCLRKTNSS
jgi:hypothetical protein